MRGNHAVAGLRPSAVAAIGLVAFTSLSTRPAAHPVTDVTWSKEIVRVLERRCAACHHRGAIGPVDLTDYADARRWGPSIKRAVLDRRMPPWQPARGFGDFANDRSLTLYELELLVAWVNGGMRVGLASDLPAEHQYPAAARLHRPDIVLTAPVRAPCRRTARCTRVSAKAWTMPWPTWPIQM
jgi:hypothetical protein